MNVKTQAAALAIAVCGAGAVIGTLMSPTASAAPHGVDAYAYESTVDVSELDFTALPTCVMEDGSDLPAASLPCVWGNQGSAWLTYEDHSLLIVDAKDGNVSDIDLGA